MVKILDFGLAMLEGGSRLTQPGLTVGTVAYMSPEQARNLEVDHRTDIWSLGVVLFEMLTGRLPFGSRFSQAVIYSILNDPIPNMLTLRPDLPAFLDQIVARALAKSPELRYEVVQQMVADLKAMEASTAPAIPALRIPLRAESRPSPASVTAPSVPSIAVMPFSNLTGDPENEYFSDGLTEELITALAHLEGLRVVSRTSVFQFKGKAEDIRKIGERLNVSNILEGSVRRAGDRVRVTVQLANAADGYQIWSQAYDRETKDLFAMQEEMAETIVSTLKVRLKTDWNVPMLGRRTDSLEAYHLYLKGRYYWHKQTEEGFKKAVEYFQQAIKEDPNYAPAYAGLADYYMALGFWSVLRPREAWLQTKQAALRALELDEQLAQAHIAMGWMRIFCDWNWQEGGEHLRRAVKLSPGAQAAHWAYGVYLTQLARLDEALVEMNRALELDPLSLYVNSSLAFLYYYDRRYGRAIEQARKTLELDPNYFEVQIPLALAQAQQGKLDEAVGILADLRSISGNNPLILGLVGYCCATSGARDQAAELLSELAQMAEQRYVAPVALALIYTGLGDKDRAFERLEEAFENCDALLCYLNVLPLYDRLRSDPRFALLLEKVGLAPGARRLK